jgi:hypothetical protein
MIDHLSHRYDVLRKKLSHVSTNHRETKSQSHVNDDVPQHIVKIN